MRRIPDWRETLPSAQPPSAPAPDPEPVPRERPRDTLHPVADREAFVGRLRLQHGLPWRSPLDLDCAPGVIPFGHQGGPRPAFGEVERSYGERDGVEAGIRARERHEARLALPWREGEWCDDAAAAVALGPARDAGRRREREDRVAWCEEIPECWPDERAAGWCDLGHGGLAEDRTWEWCNVEAVCWCLDDGGGWTDVEDRWCDDPEECDRLDRLLAAAIEEWCLED